MKWKQHIKYIFSSRFYLDSIYLIHSLIWTIYFYKNAFMCIFIPRHTKSGRYYVIPSENFECLSVCPSVRCPSVSASFSDSNLSSFWPIFFKLCMDIDIGEEWFGIANGLNSFINNRVMALDWCKNVFFLNIFRTNGWILIKFCICIDKYKIHVVSNARCFWSIFNRDMALDRRQNFVYGQYLVN